jgi:hypothetical protein
MASLQGSLFMSRKCNGVVLYSPLVLLLMGLCLEPRDQTCSHVCAFCQRKSPLSSAGFSQASAWRLVAVGLTGCRYRSSVVLRRTVEEQVQQHGRDRSQQDARLNEWV